MTSTAPERRYTFIEYLELEATSHLRYEFFDGTVYAVSGGRGAESYRLRTDGFGRLSQSAPG